MRTPLRLLAATAVLVLVAACGGAVPSSGAAATVDGEAIPRDRLEEAVRAVNSDVESLSAEEREQTVGADQRRILTFLIQDAVLSAVALEQGVELDDDDLEVSRARIIDAIGGEDALDEVLANVGLSRSLFDSVIVPQEARLAALRDGLADSQELAVRTARHILVETEAEADDVVSQLADGADFGELALEVSSDVGSAQRGGELPPAPRGAYVPEFEEAVWSAELNELVGPVQTQFGFHVIEVVAEDVTAGSELDPQQVEQLVGQQLQDLLATAFLAADITIGSGLGEWDPEQQSVVATGQVGSDPGLPLTPQG